MKKTNLRMLWCSLLACMAVLGLPSCSGNAETDAFTDEILDTYVSKDNFVVLSCDLNHFIENSGCSVSGDKIELSSDIREIINKNLSSRKAQEVFKVLELPGINPGRAIFLVDTDYGNESQFALFLTLSSEDKFCELLKDSYSPAQDYNGYKVMKSGNDYVLIKDNKAYFTSASSPQETIAILDKLKVKASQAPLTSWQKELLSDDDVMTCMISFGMIYNEFIGKSEQSDSMLRLMGIPAEKLATAYMLYSADVDGDKFEGKYALVDSDNNPISSSLLNKKVDTSMLKYANSTHRIVAMAASDGSIDWPNILRQMVDLANGYDFDDEDVAAPEDLEYDEYVDYDYWRRYYAQKTREEAAMVGEYMKYVDGTVMFAAGYTDDTNLLRMGDEDYAMRHVTAVMAAQMAPGKASELLALLRSQLDAEQVPYNFSGSHLKININGVTLEIKNQGGVLIGAYNQPISESGGCRIDSSVFDGANGGIAMKIEKNNQLLSMIGLDFGIDAEMMYKNGVLEAEFALEDASKPLIATILNLVNKY